MNTVEQIKLVRVAYNGTQNSVLKYISMRNRMGKSVVSVDEIINFFPHRISRRDTLVRILGTMVKNGFIKKVDNGYIITNIGKHVPFVVANSHMEKQIRLGKRASAVNEDWIDNE